MDHDKKVEVLLTLDKDILRLQELYNKAKESTGLQTLQEMKIKGNRVHCKLGRIQCEPIQWSDYFKKVNNVFNDELPTGEYFSLHNVLEKYLLLYPERSQDIIEQWKECLLSIKNHHQDMLNGLRLERRQTDEILSYLNLEKLCETYYLGEKEPQTIKNLFLELEIDCSKGITTMLASCFQFLQYYFVFSSTPLFGWKSSVGMVVEDMKVTNTCGKWRSARVSTFIPTNVKSVCYSFVIIKESKYTHFGVIPGGEATLAHWLGNLGGFGFSSHSMRCISQVKGQSGYVNPINEKYTTGDTVYFTTDFENKRLQISVQGKPNSTSSFEYPELSPSMDTIVSLGQIGSSVELVNVQVFE
mmetsp:Transcript_25096/g.31934  ORF Transcript_25096/g.31934 Transcript_25096/m.31934 type:complete len:357 (+) Transcript_25096:177-1247(+)